MGRRPSAASRTLYSDLNRRFPVLPFTLRALDEDKRGRLGITEILNHQLVTPYPVLAERAGELVAQFKFTAILTSSGTHRITNLTAPFAKSELAITDADLLRILQTGAGASSGSKKSKRGKKAKAAGGAMAVDDDDDDAQPAAAASEAAPTAPNA